MFIDSEALNNNFSIHVLHTGVENVFFFNAESSFAFYSAFKSIDRKCLCNALQWFPDITEWQIIILILSKVILNTNILYVCMYVRVCVYTFWPKRTSCCSRLFQTAEGHEGRHAIIWREADLTQLGQERTWQTPGWEDCQWFGQWNRGLERTKA